MRKIIYQIMISVDGFFEGPNKEIDWHLVDDEYNTYAISMLNNCDLLIFGRVTYQLMESYWPTQEAILNDPVVAERMNSIPKLVFTKTLNQAVWQNTTLANKVVPEEIEKIKKLPGKDIIIFGSSLLALEFINYKLIDEFRIVTSPIVLGNGNQLFKGINHQLKLKLVDTRKFKSGNILSIYNQI